MIRKHPSNRRSGVVLLVVITLLALFAAMGLSFVFYAEGEAQSAAIGSQAESKNRPDIDPDLLGSYFLQQLLTGAPSHYFPNANVPSGLYSSMRGNDLASSAFGYNYGAPNPNTSPFNGVERKYFTLPALPAGHWQFPNGLTYGDIANFTYFPEDGFIIDPERMFFRVGSYPGVLNQSQATPYVGWNVPYTYPDQNNPFLAAMNSSGELLAPSFFRYYSKFGPMDPSNPNWIATNSPYLKYLTVRPLPVMHPYFPRGILNALDPYKGAPSDGGGDVKNVDFGPGLVAPPGATPFPATAHYANDSIWMDLAWGVMTGPDGRKYKPLFAPLIIELDSKINVNASGNILNTSGTTPPNASASGLGPWEISLSPFLSNSDYQNIFQATWPYGKYGPGGVPGTANGLITSLSSPYQGPLTLKGVTGAGTQIARGLLPGETSNTNPNFPNFFSFPNYVTPNWPTYGVWNTGTNGVAQNSTADKTNHPASYNVFTSPYAFRDSDMEALLRYRGTGSPSLDSALFRLAGSNSGMNDPTGHNRLSLTTRSFSFGSPAASPWLQNISGYQLASGAAAYPTGTAYPYSSTLTGFPTPGTGGAAPTTGEFTGLPTPPPPGNWYYALQYLQKVNLNRPLPPYPSPNATTGVIDLTQTAINSAYSKAVSERQKLAGDIFNVLCVATTGAQFTPVAPPPPGTMSYQAYLWLAQLSVNIVDFIDSDNYITWFNWNPLDTNSGVVFGTEQPRLVINEAYAQVENNPNDPLAMMGTVATLNYNLNMWVELLNPLSSSTGQSAWDVLSGANGAGVVRLEMPAPASGAFAKYPIYQLVISPIPVPAGTPNFAATGYGQQMGNPGLVLNTVSTYSTGNTSNHQTVLPLGNAYSGAPFGKQGFYVIGPKTHPGAGAATKTNLKPTLQSAQMTTMVPKGLTPTASPNNSQVNFFLQRLACPDLPTATTQSTNPSLPNYNPFVTVDFVQNIAVYDGVKNDTVGVHTSTTPNSYCSQGRMQPFAANPMVSQPSAAATATVPTNTFFRHNSLAATAPNLTPPLNPNETLTLPFNCLVHPDRQVTSPLEILHTSAYPPYMLTQLFMNYQGQVANQPPAANLPLQKIPTQAAFPMFYGHMSMPAWLDSSARLYRALEFFDGGNRAGASAFGQGATDIYGQTIPLSGRIPGKVAINGIWDKKQLLALADPQTGLSLFSTSDVNTIFTYMLNSRSPATSGLNGLTNLPSNFDRPFKGFATANLAPGYGVEDTLLRPYPPPSPTNLPPVPNPNQDPSSRLFGLNPGATYWNLSGSNNQAYGTTAPYVPPPYFKMDLLNKLFNNVTCQSNVFAVWLTVGFFDVTDGPVTTVSPGFSVGPNWVNVAATQGTQLGVPWIIQPGCVLWVDNQPMTVRLMSGNKITFWRNFASLPTAGTSVVSMKGVLGGEVGLSEGRNVRHRMFAIVDRSALSIPAVLSYPDSSTGTTVMKPIITTTNIAAPVSPATTSATPSVSVNMALTQGVPPVPVSYTSQLTYPNTPPLPNTPNQPYLSVNSFTVNINGQPTVVPKIAPPSPANTVPVGPSLTVNYSWQIKPGMMLAIYDPNNVDPLTNQNVQEVFQVSQVAGNTIIPVSGFKHGYATGSYLLLPGRPGAVPNSILGNPGPQQMFDPRQNTALVPHFTVIQ